MIDVATCRAFYEAHPTAASFATLFGASTCACVPLIHTWNRHHLTFAMMVKAGTLDRGWPGCPTCNGEGVDPRIVASCAEAVKALELAEAACR